MYLKIVRNPLLLFIFLFPYLSFAQIKFEKLSFDQSMQKAKQAGKLIFIVVNSLDCSICNDVAHKSFTDSALSKKIRSEFIPITLSNDDPLHSSLVNNFDRNNLAGILFADGDGTIVHKLQKTSDSPKEYLEACNKAIAKKAGIDSLKQMDKDYAEGNRSIEFLENYISNRQRLDLETDQLLELYVSLLPRDSLTSERILAFIASNSPVLGSEANKAWHYNKSSSKETWYRMERKQRGEFNRRTLAKSFKKAIKEKNDSYAYRVANAARNMSSGNKKASQNSYNYYMTEYYWAVKDTNSYINSAISYIESYYTAISTDSIRKLDSIGLAKKRKAIDTIPPSDSLALIEETKPTSISKSYSGKLNLHAWRFYKVATSPPHIRKAIYWSLRAIELDGKEGAYWDTYGRLLYKLGDRKEAIEAEEKALGFIRSKGFENTTKDFEQVLKNMKAGKAAIDVH